jgi:hypothetical protein
VRRAYPDELMVTERGPIIIRESIEIEASVSRRVKPFVVVKIFI